MIRFVELSTKLMVECLMSFVGINSFPDNFVKSSSVMSVCINGISLVYMVYRIPDILLP